MQTTQCEVNLTYHGSRIKAHCQQVHGLSALRTCKLSAYVATESESPHACSYVCTMKPRPEVGQMRGEMAIDNTTFSIGVSNDFTAND
jgi:hypothetical protein